MTEPVLIDAGPLVAIFSVNDERHSECVEVLQGLKQPPITCWPVITEAAYLLRKRPDQVGMFLASLSRGAIVVDPLTNPRLLPEIQRLYGRYGPNGVQVADVCLIALSRLLGIRTPFTLDRRDFGFVSADDGGPFELVPQ